VWQDIHTRETTCVIKKLVDTSPPVWHLEDMETKSLPAVGTVVHPAITDKILYRVVEVSEHGCRVEAIGAEVVDVDGRQARPIHYSEKRHALSMSRTDGTLFDGRWRAWTVR
jgi:hypothetical protein